MQLTITLLGLAAIVLAAPAPTSNKDVANPDQVLYLITISDSESANALKIRQENRCDWDSYCLPAYQKCVKSCNSLKNSDW